MTREARLAWAAAAAALLAGGAAPARGAELLGLRATPATLLLGTDRSASLEVDVDAAPGATPVFTASAGRVVDVRPVGPGRFAATYLPPAEAYPQVAIVAAVAGGRAGWIALPLAGRGVAVARSKPGTALRVTIGGASFGPVVAGARGEARIPVIAPPGVRFALQEDQPLDLAIPETAHVHLAAEAAEAPADAEREVRVWAFAVLPGGAPRPAAPVEVTASHGWIGPLEEVAPGAFTAAWRLPPGEAGPASATARLRDEPRAAAPLELRRPAGAPARITLEAECSRAAASEAVPVRVRVADAAGNPVDATPWLQASRGALEPAARAGPGAWVARWVAPRELGAGGAPELVARAGAVEARLAIEVVSAAAAHLVVEPAAASVVADGAREVVLRARLLDPFGNPVAHPAEPAVATTLPASVAVEPDGAGAWRVRYRPARSQAGAVEQVAIEAAGVSGAARLDLRAPERRLSVGGEAGLAASTAGVRSAYVGAEAAWSLPVLGGRPALVLELGALGHDRSDRVRVAGETVVVEGASRWIALVGAVRWRQPLTARWAAWGEAGAGVAHVAAEVHAGGAPARGERAVVPAVRAALAAGLRLGHGSPFVAAGWTTFGSPELERLQGRLSVVTLSLGYRHDAY